MHLPRPAPRRRGQTASRPDRIVPPSQTLRSTHEGAPARARRGTHARAHTRMAAHVASLPPPSPLAGGTHAPLDAHVRLQFGPPCHGRWGTPTPDHPHPNTHGVLARRTPRRACRECSPPALVSYPLRSACALMHPDQRSTPAATPYAHRTSIPASISPLTGGGTTAVAREASIITRRRLARRAAKLLGRRSAIAPTPPDARASATHAFIRPTVREGECLQRIVACRGESGDW